MYELFEHTADLGLRVTAGDLDGLLAEAGRALFSVIVDDIQDVRPVSSVSLRVEGSDPAYLLVDWLAELLAVFDTRHLLLSRFEVRVRDGVAEGRAFGEPIDPARHRLLHEVKAITYHGLTVQRVEGGWKAEVIVDI